MSVSGDVFDFKGLKAMFQPASIAVLGASESPKKIGARPIRYLKRSGYAGRILPVNPGREVVQELPAYPSIGAVPEAVDLAIIALPAGVVIDAVRECADAGVKSVIIFSAGFAESGTEAGRAAQAEIGAIARETGMRVLGPNCNGAINLQMGMIGAFTTGLESGLGKPGRIGFVSQSGALGSHFFAAIRERGLGFGYWITTGNECDIEFADALAFLAQDPDTDVIAAYVEGARDGDKLRAALALAAQYRKPVVLLKAGRSEVGAQAAASHTGSLAGSDAVYAAIFEQYGVRRAYTVTEFVELTYACTQRRFPASNRIGIATVSGGAGVMMADRAEELGLDVAPMPEVSQQRMKERWPAAGVANPVDTTGQVVTDLNLLDDFMEIMLGEGGYESLVLFLAHKGLVKKNADEIREHLRGIRAAYPDRLLIISALCTPEVRADFEADGFLVFEDPVAAIDRVAALHDFARSFDTVNHMLETDAATPARHVPVLPAGAINEYQAKRLLADVGIRAPEEALVDSAQAAEAAVARMDGGPAVLKIVSAEIQHKTECGGVALNVTADNAAREYEALIERVRAHHPDAAIDGVLVCRMLSGGVETLIGVQRDPIFGPVVAFGLGGIFVETLKDVALRAAPFGRDTADAMIRQIKGYPLLAGARGRAPCDLEALADALVAVSQFAAAHADAIETIDINPYVVRSEGEGGDALDALIIPRAVG